MKKSIVLLAIAAILVPVSMQAQKKKVVAKKPKVTAPVEDPKLTRMLSATASVVIVDSVVVDSTRLLNAIYVNPEEGRVTTAGSFFNNNDIEGFAYINELGNKCIFSRMGRDGHMHIYQRDKLGDIWSDSEELKGLDDGGRLTDLNYPYMLTDGVTLYFAAKGPESLGGYDIYRTRLDAEGRKFLKPENIGLPFNSEANDYMYVVDEQNQLAYFATSRRQPKGKVCVYTFVPSETRKTLNPDAYSAEKLRSLARIDRIADTWGNGTVRKQALNRMRRGFMATNQIANASETFTFVVNDHTTYTSLSDFRSADNRDRMKDILSMQAQLSVLRTALQKARNYYATASARDRQQLSKDILDSERQEEQLEASIHQLEKEIRNTEKRE
ncbi:MAG: hypothetical protein IJ841_09635 [Prevotella sp.]|nr:hypothetical protein [Prevotella sp.]